VKRLVLAAFILSASLALFFTLRNVVARTRHDLVELSAASQARSQQSDRLETMKRQLVKHVKETRQSLAEQPASPPLDALKKKVLSGASWRSFSPAERAQLLAELGFNWNTTGDYLLISKKSLDAIGYSAMHGSQLTPAAIGALALSDDEQSAINTMTSQLMDARLAWAREHLQRTEPSGDILAQYTLPVDTELSQAQYATFTNSISSTLGGQRGQWLLNQSQQWLQDNGMSPGFDLSSLPVDYSPNINIADVQSTKPTVMTLKADGQEVELNLQLAGASMSCTISPWQPVPPAFSMLFPGGWQQIAQLDGFQLPKSFDKSGQ
jgi:hypothetical protein